MHKASDDTVPPTVAPFWRTRAATVIIQYAYILVPMSCIVGLVSARRGWAASVSEHAWHVSGAPFDQRLFDATIYSNFAYAVLAVLMARVGHAVSAVAVLLSCVVSTAYHFVDSSEATQLYDNIPSSGGADALSQLDMVASHAAIAALAVELITAATSGHSLRSAHVHRIAAVTTVFAWTAFSAAFFAVPAEEDTGSYRNTSGAGSIVTSTVRAGLLALVIAACVACIRAWYGSMSAAVDARVRALLILSTVVALAGAGACFLFATQEAGTALAARTAYRASSDRQSVLLTLTYVLYHTLWHVMSATAGMALVTVAWVMRTAHGRATQKRGAASTPSVLAAAPMPAPAPTSTPTPTPTPAPVKKNARRKRRPRRHPRASSANTRAVSSVVIF